MSGFIPKKDSSNTHIFGSQKTTGNFDTTITHNWCDNTSWVVSTSDSTWKLEPSSGKIIDVVKAEVQFEHDLSIGTSDIHLDYYVWHPSSPGTPILGQRITFDNARTLFEYGNSHYHAPALPELPNGLTTIVFDYANKLSFNSNEVYGDLAYLQITTEAHAEVTGSYATVGFVTEERDA